jgi:hypothetical protein
VVVSCETPYRSLTMTQKTTIALNNCFIAFSVGINLLLVRRLFATVQHVVLCLQLHCKGHACLKQGK